MLVRMPRTGNARSAAEARDNRSVARLGRRDQLREQRVVVDGDRAAFVDAGVDADARARPARDRAAAAGLRQEILRRIFGVDAALDRVAALGRQRPCAHGSGSPAATANCALHEIDAGHRFGDRMLDLQPRVHLEEIELRVVAARPRAGTRSCRRCGSRPRAPRRPRPRPSASRSGGVSAGDGLSSTTFCGAAGSSTRARRGARRGRGRRRRPGPRRGADVR